MGNKCLVKIEKHKRLGIRFLRLEINDTKVEINQADVTSSNKTIYYHADEKQLVKIEDLDRWFSSWMLFVFTLFFLYFCWGDKMGLLGLVLPSAILTILLLVWAIFKPEQRIIFNRDEGTITYPGFLWSKPIYIRFDDVAANISNSGKVSVLKLYHPSLFTYRSIITATSNLVSQWSYFVWYMDKNRPLPPGDAFDPYRDADFERRRAEGFPMPKYISIIETPEATKRQQLERNQYWEEKSRYDSGKRTLEIIKKHHPHKPYSDEVKKNVKHLEPNVELFDIDIHTDWERIRCIDEDNKTIMTNTFFRFHMNTGLTILVKSDFEGYIYHPPKGSYSKIEISEKENIEN